MNKRNLRLVAAVLWTAFRCVSVNAQDESWNTVEIPGICSFKIPSTVEVQAGSYKEISNKYQERILSITVSPDRVVAQPKGINEMDPDALKRYCRVIVETNRDKPGDWEKLGTRIRLSKPDLKMIDDMFKKGVENEAMRVSSRGLKMEILSWNPATVEKINGIDTMKISYTRSTNDGPPVLVNMHSIDNNDFLHRITISYRLSEKELWAEDLMKVLDTFEFVRR